MPQVLPIKENLSNLLELASDGNCSLLFEGINQHLASEQVLKSIPGRNVGIGRTVGPVAQLVEHMTCKQGIGVSTPASDTLFPPIIILNPSLEEELMACPLYSIYLEVLLTSQ